MISSLTFLGFSVCLLTYSITKNYLASILAGLLVIFSPATLDHKIHLQILAIEFVPIGILFFIQFLKTNNLKFLVFSMICLVVQTYNSFLPGYFLVVSYGVLIVGKGSSDIQSLRDYITKTTVLICIGTIICLTPIIIPYFQVSHEFQYVRNIRDTIHFAMQPEDLLVTSADSRFQSLLTRIQNPQNYPANSEIKPGFLGVEFSLLMIFTAIFS